MCMTPSTKCSYLIIHELRLCLIIESSSISTMCCTVLCCVYFYISKENTYCHFLFSYFRYQNHQSAIGRCYSCDYYYLLFGINTQYTKYRRVKQNVMELLLYFIYLDDCNVYTGIERISWRIGQFGILYMMIVQFNTM